MRFNGLDLNLLLALQVLLEERNVTRAARRLNISQPAMSAALARLRDYFQDDLLTAHGRQMHPTAQAERLAGPVQRMLADLDALLTSSARFDPATTQRSFRLVASDYISASVIAPLAARLAPHAPRVRIEMMLPCEEAAQLVMQGQADLIITPDDFVDPDQPAELLCEEPQVVVGWRDNAVFRSGVDAAAFSRLGHVAVHVGSNQVPSFADRHLERMGIARRIEVTCGCFTLVPFLVCGTARLAVMHERLARQMAAAFPLAVAPLPFDFPVMREMIQYHRVDDPVPPGPRGRRGPALAENTAARAGPASRHQPGGSLTITSIGLAAATPVGMLRRANRGSDVKDLSILVVGAGIGGLTCAIALRQQGFAVHLVEKDPAWSVYGVGIIQQGNVLRAIDQLGVLDRYIDAGAGFDAVEVFAPNGQRVARVPSPRLLPDRPANVGISRRALQDVLGKAALEAGATLRLGVTVTALRDSGEAVEVVFSDGKAGRYDLVVGADGVHSQIRTLLFPDAPGPQFTGQAVWRCNLPRPAGLDALQAYNGPIGAGLVPMSDGLMYMFLTTPEPDNPRYAREGLAARMRAKAAGCAPAIRELAEQIQDDAGVVYRPLEWLLLEGPWHRGRVVLLGDSVHTTTPHLGQGAGMAIEDSLVLAEELARHAGLAEALQAYGERRQDRCRYIVQASLAICMGQLGKGPPVDNARATAEMFARTAQPI